MNLLDRMKNHPHVKVKELGDGLYACNFTRQAFRKNVWDQDTCAARGLILDAEGNVKARGFEKFFGLDEYNGPTMEEYARDAVYPVFATEKANGYLAIVSVIEGRLMVFSKSGYTDYSLHAQKMMAAAWTPWQKAVLIEYLRTHDVSLLIEVIDPQKDPHIVQYRAPHLVLLNLVKNQEEFQIDMAGEDEIFGSLIAILEISVRRARLAHVFESDEALRQIVPVWQRSPIIKSEGLVLCDSEGKMTKVKSKEYKEVKSYRNSLNKALKGEVDQRAQKVIDRLEDGDPLLTLEDFVVEGICGPTLNLPALRPFILEEGIRVV